MLVVVVIVLMRGSPLCCCARPCACVWVATIAFLCRHSAARGRSPPSYPRPLPRPSLPRSCPAEQARARAPTDSRGRGAGDAAPALRPFRLRQGALPTIGHLAFHAEVARVLHTHVRVRARAAESVRPVLLHRVRLTLPACLPAVCGAPPPALRAQQSRRIPLNPPTPCPGHGAAGPAVRRDVTSPRSRRPSPPLLRVRPGGRSALGGRVVPIDSSPASTAPVACASFPRHVFRVCARRLRASNPLLCRVRCRVCANLSRDEVLLVCL